VPIVEYEMRIVISPAGRSGAIARMTPLSSPCCATDAAMPSTGHSDSEAAAGVFDGVW